MWLVVLDVAVVDLVDVVDLDVVVGLCVVEVVVVEPCRHSSTVGEAGPTVN